MVAVNTLVKPQYKPPTRTTTDSKGVACELWEIPGHSRYYLVRREGDWSVYDRLKKRPVTRYTKNVESPQYYVCRLVSNEGKIHQHLEHRIVMQCLSLDEPKKSIRHRNNNTLDNRFENLYYWDRKLSHAIRDTRTGEIYAGTIREIRDAAKIGYEKARDILAGKPVKNWELIRRDGNV